ncbi:hypothetical protein V8G54_014967 [Vigna mungo]|uniref:EamA domain-containing protein n=1 Tax=Vigna mungo TaxID=3915 RepID=A0AAQ3NJB9_VIGMU
MNPAAFTFVRFALSAIPFIPFVVRGWRDSFTRNSGIELGIWALGLQTSDAGRASFLSMFTVIVVPLLDGLLGAAVPTRTWFGALMSIVGVGMLESSGSSPRESRNRDILGNENGSIEYQNVVQEKMALRWGTSCGLTSVDEAVGLGWYLAYLMFFAFLFLYIPVNNSGSLLIVGDLLNFLSAVSFGIHMLRTEHLSRKINKEKFLPLLGYEICVVVLFSAIWYLLGGYINGFQHPLPSSWTWKMLRDWMTGFPWIPAIYTGIFSTGLCLWVELSAMSDVSATETAIIYGLEPVWGAGFAWFLLGERWGLTGWVGAALVLGMVSLQNYEAPMREQDAGSMLMKFQRQQLLMPRLDVGSHGFTDGSGFCPRTIRRSSLISQMSRVAAVHQRLDMIDHEVRNLYLRFKELHRR